MHTDVVAGLGDPGRARSCREFPWDRDDLKSAGLYSWWVAEDGASRLTRGLGQQVEAGLIYAGQTGADSAVAQLPRVATLAGRTGRQHLRGRITASTFRLTLTASLAGEFGLTFSAPAALTPASSAALTAWMHAHLSLICVPVADRAAVAVLERDLLRRLDPPLNLMGMAATPLRAALSQRRRAVRRGDTGWAEV